MNKRNDAGPLIKGEFGQINTQKTMFIAAAVAHIHQFFILCRACIQAIQVGVELSDVSESHYNACCLSRFLGQWISPKVRKEFTRLAH